MLKGLSPIQEEMVLENRRLVYYLVKKAGVPFEDYEDVVSIGTIGLIKAAITYEESKKIKFATYAARCINNEIYMYFRKENKNNQEISMETSIRGQNGENERTIKDILFDEKTTNFMRCIENEELIENAIKIILNCMEHKERDIILLLIAGIKQKDVAKIMGLSQSYVSRLEKGIRDKMTRAIGKQKNFGKFSVEMRKEEIQISFYLEKVAKFRKDFDDIILKIRKSTQLQYFKIVYVDGQVKISLLAEPKYFLVIAMLLREIEELDIETNDKNTISTNEYE